MSSLHITNAYHPDSGGVRTFYRALMEQAPAHEHQMRLIVPSDTTRVEVVNRCARIYHVQAKPSPIGDARYRLLWPWGKTGRSIRDILLAEQPDLVEVGDKYTLPTIAGLLRYRCIPGVRRPRLLAISHERMDDNLRSYFQTNAVGTLLSRVYMNRLYFPIFDVHVANSRYTAEELVKASRWHRLHRPIHVLPMGVDVVAFDPRRRTPAARKRLAERAGVPESVRLLVYAGRLSHEKNIGLLEAVIARLSQSYALIVAGDGDLRDSLEGAGARVLGHLRSREELSEIYAGADAFIHPNPREPFGIAPLEAMAAGLPVVCPDPGGIRSYAGPENAWLAAPDPDAYIAAIEELFSNPTARSVRTAEARQTAERHAWPHVAASYFTLFGRLTVSRELKHTVSARKEL